MCLAAQAEPARHRRAGPLGSESAQVRVGPARAGPPQHATPESNRLADASTPSDRVSPSGATGAGGGTNSEPGRGEGGVWGLWEE
jgi:hypothetical protein